MTVTDRINRVHCLFEQSGTFKNAFKALGYEAIDYDIADDFGETDRKIDLFSEILRGGKTNLVYSTRSGRVI